MQTIPKLLTFEEFLEQYPDEGGIYELINGEMIAVNPSGKHEEVIAFTVAELNFEIRRQNFPYFLPRTCTVKANKPNTAYKPDIIILDRNAITTEPLWEKSSTLTKGESAILIIEVVSTNWREDYGYKLIEYEALGIPEYWIIDYLALGGRRYIGNPKQQTITVYELVDGEYQLQQFRGSELTSQRWRYRIRSHAFPELNLTAEQIFIA